MTEQERNSIEEQADERVGIDPRAPREDAPVERRFPLTRYFVLTSFLTTLVIAVGTAFIASYQVEQDLLERARDQAVRVIGHIESDIRTRFIEPTMAEYGDVNLDEPEQYDKLNAVVQRVAESFDLKNIYVFDRDGVIYYSTIREHVGARVPEGNRLFREALAGNIASAVRRRGAPLDLQPESGGTALLETYVPVRGPDGSVINVIESYQNIDQLQREVQSARLRVAFYAFLGTTILFLVLIGIVMRADKLISDQTEALIDRNQKLTDLSKHLEAEVERRTHELIEKEKLASIGVLAAGLAHEVNNPMATIASCAEGLVSRLEAAKSGEELRTEEFDRYLRLIADESFRVKHITQSLLDFSRQKPVGSRERVDVLGVVNDTVELLGVADPVPIEVHGPGHEVLTPVEATDFRQLVFNITQNAVDAVHEQFDGAAVQQGRVEWTISNGNGFVELVCRDNGIGFEPDRARQLLQPFYTTKPPGKGTGLGLALCHSMVDRHGGRIVLESAGPGKGSEVRIEFPLEVENEE